MARNDSGEAGNDDLYTESQVVHDRKRKQRRDFREKPDLT